MSEAPPEQSDGVSEAPPEQRHRIGSPLRKMVREGVGVPLLFAVGYSAVGFSIYFSIGVVADRGLGLTPVIFLVAGLIFSLTTLTYFEGGSMFLERGGSTTFARHAFNELVAFIAGWAILIDYLIIIALAAISVPHYLTPISPHLSDGGVEIGMAALVIAFAVVVNIRGATGKGHERALVVFALADVLLQLAVIVVGALVVLHPDRLTDRTWTSSTCPAPRTSIYASWSSRCSPSPGSRPRPTSPPRSSRFAAAICGAWSAPRRSSCR